MKLLMPLKSFDEGELLISERFAFIDDELMTDDLPLGRQRTSRKCCAIEFFFVGEPFRDRASVITQETAAAEGPKLLSSTHVYFPMFPSTACLNSGRLKGHVNISPLRL